MMQKFVDQTTSLISLSFVGAWFLWWPGVSYSAISFVVFFSLSMHLHPFRLPVTGLLVFQLLLTSLCDLVSADCHFYLSDSCHLLVTGKAIQSLAPDHFV
jgi:hypothetical protein